MSSDSPRLLEQVRNIAITYKATAGSGMSISDVSKIARVEPITLISSSLASQKELYNILHGVLNIYAAYYLQAVNILSAQLADVRILKILDKTNPDRDLKTALTSGYIAYESKDLSRDELKDLRKNIRTLSLEGSDYKLPFISKEDLITSEYETENTLDTSIRRVETFERLGSAVGKVIELKFKSTDENDSRKQTEIGIPAVVKLDTMIIPSDVVGSIMVSNKDEITLGSRFRDVISGRISFIKDFLLSSDLIKHQKQSMMKDPTGAYATLMKRINNSKVYSALTGNMSLAGVSSILVISEEDEHKIQTSLGGKLTNEKTRNIVFNNTSAMMIVVIDKEWERVSIYVKDTSGYSQNSFDSFKNSDKANNDNINELVKSLSMNQAPSF